MGDSLQHVLNTLTTAQDTAVLNDLDDSISALREQLSLTELLSRVDAAQLSSDQFVSLVYVVVKSAPVEWLVPELCRADQEGATAAGSGAGEGCNSERTPRPG